MLTEYLEVFLEELEEQLQFMDEYILLLEQEGGTDETVQNLFRAATAGPQEGPEIQALAADGVDVADVRTEPVVWEEVNMTLAPAEKADRQAPEDIAQLSKSKSQTIRVSVERLDHLMNLVGELVIDQTRIHQVERTQRRRFQDETVSELGHISDHLARMISDLQESVMKARMPSCMRNSSTA